MPKPGTRPSAFGSPKHRKLLGWGTSAAIGGFTVGYHLGVISGALLLVRERFGPSNLEQDALVGILPLGAMVGGLYAGRFADALGRRGTSIVDAVVFVVGIVLTMIAPSFVVLLVGRAITGLAPGAASSTVPLYLSEISQPALRGGLVTLNQLMVTLGSGFVLVDRYVPEGKGRSFGEIDHEVRARWAAPRQEATAH